jgi:uncharacterized short protein YbdD (DUF466 family)
MRLETDGRDGVLHRFFRVIRQILGAPDYGAYVEHCRSAGHPPELTEREYIAACFASKGRDGRCC